jgi:beta-1,4-mannosyltransferase
MTGSMMPPPNPPNRRQPSQFVVASYPANGGGNPYLDLFYQSLADQGVGHCQLVVNDEWLREHAKQFDAVHIHWPEELWRIRGRGPASRLRGVVGLRRFLRVAAALGLKRIWTLHNLEPHEGSDWVDVVGHRVLAQNVDLILCHSEWAASIIRRRYFLKTPVVVMPIGSYAGAYPGPRKQSTFLDQLGLDRTRPIVSVIGALRPYKGIETALAASTILDGRVQLVVAGEPHDALDAATLSPLRRAGDVVLPRRLSDQEFVDLITASAAIILPYRKITGSSALLAAWTLGRGVIASDHPYFREMFEGEPDAGRLFPVGDAAELARSISEYLEVPEVRRITAANRLGERFSWTRTIRPVVDVIESWAHVDRDRDTTAA